MSTDYDIEVCSSDETYSNSSEDNSKARKKYKQKNDKKKQTIERKGPGRPRKTPKKEPLARRGISNTPSNQQEYIEFLYDQPLILKKIFSFFRSLSVTQVQMLFRERDIIFYTKDYYEVSKIYVRIDASKINHYYCRGVLDIGICAKEMDLILNKVDNKYSTIIILSSMNTMQRSINIVFETDMKIQEMHTIDLIGQYAKMEDEYLFLDKDYTIQFEFPSRFFKKMINDIKTMSNLLSILQEDPHKPLVFEYYTQNKKIYSKYVANDNESIKLISNITEDSSFRIDIKVDHISPISKAQISDSIIILIDENKPFMTRAIIDDGTIEIKTITQIIDGRPIDV
jgi:hypothetical protein